MPIINIMDAKRDEYYPGRVHETLVGDDEGSTSVRVEIQTSPPGYQPARMYIPTWKLSP